MKRFFSFVVAAALALAPASAQSPQVRQMLLGVGKPSGAPAVATFVRVGPDQTQVGSSAWTSTALSTASSPADRFIIVVATDQNAAVLSSITVNGVSLAQDISAGALGGAPNARIWSGLVGAAGGNSLSIVATYVSAGFTTRTIEVWMGTGLTNTAGADTTTNAVAASTMTINVTSGRFLIAANGDGLTFTGSAPDSSPATSQSNSTFTPPTAFTAEWNTLTATNTSFVITASFTANMAAATYH